jgi:hypothetical protein
MKVCSKCNIEKDEKEFNRRFNGLQPYCRDCNRSKLKDYYRSNKAHAIAYSNKVKWRTRARALKFVMDFVEVAGGCKTCGEKDFRCIEFDHRDPLTKKFAISKMVGAGYGIKRIAAEIEKCDILCANCHKKRTAEQFNWYQNLIPHMDD